MISRVTCGELKRFLEELFYLDALTKGASKDFYEHRIRITTDDNDDTWYFSLVSAIFLKGRITAFYDCGEFDYIDNIILPSGIKIEFEQIHNHHGLMYNLRDTIFEPRRPKKLS